MAEGFRRAGIIFDVSIDADPDACDSYEANLGHRPIQADAREVARLGAALRWGRLPRLVVADPPCTPWSTAGKRLGTADPRDMLTTTIEILEQLRPLVWLIGNVPGLDNAIHWKTTVQPIIGGFAKRHGYCVDYARLDAADFGVPQHRRRPFWFGHPKGTPCIRWPEPTHGDATTLRLDGCRPWVTCREALSHLCGEDLGRPVRLRYRACSTAQHGSVGESPARVVGTSHLCDGNVLITAEQVLDEKRRRRAGRKPPCSFPEEPAATVVAQASRGGGATLAVLPNHPVSNADESARTLRASDGGGAGGPRPVVEWPWDTPATTVCVDSRIAPPGHHSEQGSILSTKRVIQLSEKAALILQGFPPGWVVACSGALQMLWISPRPDQPAQGDTSP
jgi:site-specific DNA-cytosine methylase